MDFVTIDFETAHLHFPCEMGVTVVQENRIVSVKSRLIKPSCYPYFHWYAKKIHGIKPTDVATEPTFDVVWEEFLPQMEGKLLIAHNADFDMGVIRKGCLEYKLPKPKNRYLCSIDIARLTWPDQTHYGLEALCEQEHILLDHHRAGADAEACAKIMLRAFSILEVNSLQDLKEKFNIRTKRI